MQQSLFGAVLTPETELSKNLSLDVLVSEAIFTVIDLETTGLNKQKNAITEVTAIQYKNGEDIKVFSTLVQPTEPIPPEAEAITGISNEMVKNAPPLISVLNELCSFMGPNPIIVGHNVSFDIGFLREKLQQNGMGSLVERINPERALCTKVLAQKALPSLPSYEGMVVATTCGVHNPNPHRAEADVRMSAGILFKLVEKLQQEGQPIRTVADLIAYQGSI